MTARVIAVSREVGSGGEEIALEASRQLGFRYIDAQVVQSAATIAGASVETVESAEKAPSLMERILSSLATAPAVPDAWAEPVPLATNPLSTSSAYRGLIERVVRQLADEGNCLILGHAAHLLLRERADTLRVLVTASRDSRVARVLRSDDVSSNQAAKIVEQSDTERREYFRRIYDSDWLAPENYDLCITTSSMTDAAAVATIVAAAQIL